jgi:YebC/PmpR family DNA-binding regulatory protein
MAGHSKWKNIKHKKAAADAIKMRGFTKLSKEITVAAKLGADIASNPTLRTLIEKANEINMPKENYLRAIKKASGSDKIVYETAFYQGYGPAQAAIIVEVLSDNKNRAAAEVRRAFTHNGGRIAEPGSVEWMFTKCGLIEGISLYQNEEELLESLLDFTLHDFHYDNNDLFVAVEINDLKTIKELLVKNKCQINEAYIGYHPQKKLMLCDEENEQLANFVAALEEVDDIQNIFINA